MKKLALLNTSILTTAGVYELTDISLEQARQMVADNADNLDSAVGHQATADIMTALLGIDIPVNRQLFLQEIGQQALVFKLKGLYYIIAAFFKTRRLYDLLRSIK
jgi:hypothetical protein